MPQVAALRASPGALEVALDEDPSARLAFSRRGNGTRVQRPGPGSVSLVAGMPPATDGEQATARARGRVLAARAGLAASVGLPPDQVVYAAQVHGAQVAVVTRAHAGSGALDHADAIPDVDALVTAEPDLGVAVMAADCVPLLLVDPGLAVGAVHAGRRGVHAEVVPAALGALARVSGDDPRTTASRVVAVIGPAIGGCCYEVPLALARQVAAAVPAAAATSRRGRPALDLPAGVLAQLRDAGVARVERVGGCTRCGGDDWFSARGASGADDATRRERRVPEGRHAGIACRTPGSKRASGPPAGPVAASSLECRR